MKLRSSLILALFAALGGCGSNAGGGGVSGSANAGASSAGNAAAGAASVLGGASGVVGGATGTSAGASALGGAAGGVSVAGSANGGAGGVSTGGAGGSAHAAGASGAAVAGASGASMGGAGLGNGGSSAGGSAGSAASAGSGGSAGSSFSCNLVIGVSPTGQWFDSGFLSLVDGSRWESIWVAHHYTNFWADPQDSAWSTAFDPYPGPAHACTAHPTAPDRVVFVAVNWQYTTAAQWEADLTKIIANLQSKYPSVRRIELMTLTRAPGNQLCSATGSTETIIPAWTDVAIAAMATQYPGLVVQAPKFEIPHCSDFVDNGNAPQYTAAGAADVAQLFGAYYAQHP